MSNSNENTVCAFDPHWLYDPIPNRIDHLQARLKAKNKRKKKKK
jgi:hypothetical protein